MFSLIKISMILTSLVKVSMVSKVSIKNRDKLTINDTDTWFFFVLYTIPILDTDTLFFYWFNTYTLYRYSFFSLLRYRFFLLFTFPTNFDLLPAPHPCGGLQDALAHTDTIPILGTLKNNRYLRYRYYRRISTSNHSLYRISLLPRFPWIRLRVHPWVKIKEIILTNSRWGAWRIKKLFGNFSIHPI